MQLTDAEFITDMQTYKLDHTPDGWPAIQQKDLDRLINIIFKMANNDNNRLIIHILKNWGREKIEKFASHLLGEI